MNQNHTSPVHTQDLSSQQWDYRKLSNRMTPTTIRTEVPSMPMASSTLSATNMHASPSTISPAESSPQEVSQSHDIYGRSVQAGNGQSYHMPQKSEAGLQYQHYPQGQGHSMNGLPNQPTPNAAMTPMAAPAQQQQSQHTQQQPYSTSTVEQQQQIYYDQLPFQEPVGVVQPQQYPNLRYAYGISAGEDLFKPEDYGFQMLVQSNEHMLPSERMMNSY
ncbi:MAG: hypothetical protein Q9160_003362 [Pyrenula sp. 1 TL-2023]